jgi:head-tail adaptor
MRAGIMRNVADIEKPVVTISDTGDNVYTYKATTGSYKVPVSARNISQRKTEDGFVQGSGEEEWEIRLRYRSDVTYNTRLKFYTSRTTFFYLKINQIENIENKSKDLRLRCERVEV